MMELIGAHPRALADVLGALTPTQWQAPSLCAGWTAAHVTAHLTMPFRFTGEQFMAGLSAAGGDFTAYSNAVDGLALRADDLDWSHGTGESVTGRGRDLLLAAGRDIAREVFGGPGAGRLARAGQ